MNNISEMRSFFPSQVNFIYTASGLKIRLNPKAVDEVLKPLTSQAGENVLNEVLVDVESWALLPQAVSNVSCITGAVLSQDWLGALGAGLAGFVVGNILQQLPYSKVLVALFPLSLGSWLISFLFAFPLAIFFFLKSQAVVAVVLLLIVFLNWMHYTDLLLFLLMPIRVAIKKALFLPMGDVERAFISVCNRKAMERGVDLDWAVYDRTMEI